MCGRKLLCTAGVAAGRLRFARDVTRLHSATRSRFRTASERTGLRVRLPEMEKTENPMLAVDDGGEDNGRGTQSAELKQSAHQPAVPQAGEEVGVAPHRDVAGDEMSGLSLRIGSLHLLTAHTLLQEDTSAARRWQTVAASVVLVVTQIWTLAAVMWAVALPSCSHNRQCGNNQYC